jgi:hypothetical protein
VWDRRWPVIRRPASAVLGPRVRTRPCMLACPMPTSARSVFRRWPRRASATLEPPCTDPYARWCGRGRRATAAPMPINRNYVHQPRLKQSLNDLWGRRKPPKLALGSVRYNQTPEVQRLREMSRVLENLPANCIEHSSVGSTEEFQKWQRAVLNFSGWDHQEALHDVISQMHLDPRLQSALRQLRFSPYGKLIRTGRCVTLRAHG